MEFSVISKLFEPESAFVDKWDFWASCQRGLRIVPDVGHLINTTTPFEIIKKSEHLSISREAVLTHTPSIVNCTLRNIPTVSWQP